VIPVITLQGFGIFGNFRVNPSERICEDLGAVYPASRARIISHVLTTSADAVSAIPRLMAEDQSDAWIGLGLAGGRSAAAVERVAINLADYRMPDQGGRQLTDAPIAPDGPVAYWTTLPVQEILAAWRERDIPGYVSYSAGTFLCNHAFYLARHTAAETGRPAYVGFIHIPAMVQQVANPGSNPALPYAVLRDAVSTVLDVVADAVAHHLTPAPAPDVPETSAPRVPAR
jgi:pyroglutamyl-peptidase